MTSGLFWGRTHLGMALSCSLGAERWAGWMVGVCPWFWVFGGEGRQTEPGQTHCNTTLAHRAENRHPCFVFPFFASPFRIP